jgi:hypothetical protein
MSQTPAFAACVVASPDLRSASRSGPLRDGAFGSRRRRASKKGGHYNLPTEWVWSPVPTREPLTTGALFEAAGAGSVRRGRPSLAPATQPQAAGSP